MNRFRFQPVGALAASVAAAATFAPAAQADFTTRRWTSDTNFELVISHMPDFDQQRTGLGACGTGADGANFCVPTSTANLFAYIAQHGDPSVAPGDHNWTSATNYSTATNFISTLATKMSTSNCNGTTNSDPFEFLKFLDPRHTRVQHRHQQRSGCSDKYKHCRCNSIVSLQRPVQALRYRRSRICVIRLYLVMRLYFKADASTRAVGPPDLA
jgi:hypothetical protein